MHRETHKETPSLKCDRCAFVTKTPARLRAHQLGHDRRYPCEECGRVFSAKHDMLVHRKMTHPPKDAEKMRCPDCDFQTLYKHHLTAHRRARHGDGRPALTCSWPDCDFRTTKHVRTQLISHMNGNFISIFSIVHSHISRPTNARTRARSRMPASPVAAPSWRLAN